MFAHRIVMSFVYVLFFRYFKLINFTTKTKFHQDNNNKKALKPTNTSNFEVQMIDIQRVSMLNAVVMPKCYQIMFRNTNYMFIFDLMIFVLFRWLRNFRIICFYVSSTNVLIMVIQELRFCFGSRSVRLRWWRKRNRNTEEKKNVQMRATYENIEQTFLKIRRYTHTIGLMNFDVPKIRTITKDKWRKKTCAFFSFAFYLRFGFLFCSVFFVFRWLFKQFK